MRRIHEVRGWDRWSSQLDEHVVAQGAEGLVLRLEAVVVVGMPHYAAALMCDACTWKRLRMSTCSSSVAVDIEGSSVLG